MEKKIYELSKPKQIHTYRTADGIQYGIITQAIMDFESLCYSLYKADGNVTVADLKRMNCIEFYTHKKNLTEFLKRSKQKEKE